MSKIRLATFNVNSVRSRLPILERWLPDADVDILCLQETKATDADFPRAPLEALGYHVCFCGEKSYNGVAVLSRPPLDEVQFGFADGEEPDLPTRVAFVRAGGLAVLNTYVPQGKEIDHPDYRLKKRFLERVRALIDKRVKKDEPFAWVGDLNVAPSDIDVTNPANKKNHVCCHVEVREKFAATVSGCQLTDLLRKYHSEAGEYTFFDYRVKDSLARNIGWRIDHMMTNGALAARALDCFVDRTPRGWEKPSDHTPLLADFDL